MYLLSHRQLGIITRLQSFTCTNPHLQDLRRTGAERNACFLWWAGSQGEREKERARVGLLVCLLKLHQYPKQERVNDGAERSQPSYAKWALYWRKYQGDGRTPPPHTHTLNLSSEKTLEIVWSIPFEEIWANTDGVTYIARGRLLGWARSPGTWVLRSFLPTIQALDLLSGIFDMMMEGK